MITKVVLAKLSPTMEEGTIVKWSKQEGDAIKVGDVLAEIETDKANMEMEALGDGRPAQGARPGRGQGPGGRAHRRDRRPRRGHRGRCWPRPRRPRLRRLQAAPAPAAPSAPAPAAPVAVAAPAPPPVAAAAPAAAAGGRVKASPLARAIAAQKNVPLASVAGTGPGGRIVKRDVEGYLAAPPAPPTSARAAASSPAPRAVVPVPSVAPGTAIPLTSMRRTIAKRLAESLYTAPHFYVTVEIDMDAAVSLREQLLRAEDVKVSYNDLVLKACAKALTRFPTVNASWTGEAIQTHAEVHLGVAVSLAEGLITPVVRNADRKHVVEISREVKDLAARAREKKLKPEEFMGSTFTISNLGMFDVSEFTAIINPPESAILAVGAVRKVPVVKDDQLAVGHRMKVTLSSDHRVVDGALAAQFLAEVRRLLENPVGLLL